MSAEFALALSQSLFRFFGSVLVRCSISWADNACFQRRQFQQRHFLNVEFRVFSIHRNVLPYGGFLSGPVDVSILMPDPSDGFMAISEISGPQQKPAELRRRAFFVGLRFSLPACVAERNLAEPPFGNYAGMITSRERTNIGRSRCTAKSFPVRNAVQILDRPPGESARSFLRP